MAGRAHKIRLHNTSENDQEMTDSPSRSSTRFRKKPQKFGDFLQITPTKRNTHRDATTSEEEMDYSEVEKIKPTALFSNGDVEGQDMFQFKMRHTKQDLKNVVDAAITNTPKSKIQTPRTPKSAISRAMQNSISKGAENTPRHVKNIIKKRIIKEVESDSAESDFSGDSSSDFVPEGSENETALSRSSASEVSDDDNDKPQKPQEKAAVVRGRGKAKPKDSEYFVTPDNYFMMHSSTKILTSDHTLARLKNLDLNDNESQDIEISREHKEKIAELNKSYKNLFNRWLYVLSENFNIILYGIGSKKSILHQFQAEKLKDFPCIVINGFFPSLTIKSVLEAIVMDLLGNTHVPSNIGDTVNLIDSQLAENEAELFLIVHNIDGAMLRNAKAQTTLASLSQIRNIHMIATVDHINAPLLWDHSKLSKFQFTWWDVTTFHPYLEETSFETCLMSARSGALQLSSLRSVYQSLTSNAKGIFNVIIEYQLENQKTSHYQGLPFKELYSKCREQFLVSSDLALRAQLTEFLDHKLVRMKRTLDGSENLVVPTDTALLQQFLEQHNT